MPLGKSSTKPIQIEFGIPHVTDARFTKITGGDISPRSEMNV